MTRACGLIGPDHNLTDEANLFTEKMRRLVSPKYPAISLLGGNAICTVAIPTPRMAIFGHGKHSVLNAIQQALEFRGFREDTFDHLGALVVLHIKKSHQNLQNITEQFEDLYTSQELGFLALSTGAQHSISFNERTVYSVGKAF